ncbi:hypothetical protein LAZ67_9002113 [Cordylochernes scorpioides]|uniref:Uncharacterized protein n=1 Tax=Cordylochernes scorpioides TaxID=51811 RepID=A0ABY6KTJ1_9ARAC|nr:hypothetical protein LAZ67_9002113 [Cordylochernes scorpioides]
MKATSGVNPVNNTSIEQGSETINQVLLATAQIIVEGEGGTQQICRALLDSGSQFHWEEGLVRVSCTGLTWTAGGVFGRPIAKLAPLPFTPQDLN